MCNYVTVRYVWLYSGVTIRSFCVIKSEIYLCHLSFLYANELQVGRSNEKFEFVFFLQLAVRYLEGSCIFSIMSNIAP